MDNLYYPYITFDLHFKDTEDERYVEISIGLHWQAKSLPRFL